MRCCNYAESFGNSSLNIIDIKKSQKTFLERIQFFIAVVLLIFSISLIFRPEY